MWAVHFRAKLDHLGVHGAAHEGVATKLVGAAVADLVEEEVFALCCRAVLRVCAIAVLRCRVADGGGEQVRDVRLSLGGSAVDLGGDAIGESVHEEVEPAEGGVVLGDLAGFVPRDECDDLNRDHHVKGRDVEVDDRAGGSDVAATGKLDDIVRQRDSEQTDVSGVRE